MRFFISSSGTVPAALVPELAKRNFRDSRIAGDASVLVFPDLEAAITDVQAG